MKKLIFTISILGLIFIGCADDDNPVASPTFTEGTYNMTSMTEYDNADCTGVGMSGVCMSDETATTEATCPSGVCYDDDYETVEAADQAACTAADGYWSTGNCMSDETATTAATCVGACYGESMVCSCWSNIGEEGEATCESGDLLDEDSCLSAGQCAWDCENNYTEIEATDEDACEAADGEWMGWMNMGWISYAEDSDWSLTFGANGVYTDGDESGTYTVDGTTITVVVAAGCYDNDDEYLVAADCAACETAGGSWDEAETLTGTLDIAAGTISVEMSNEGCWGVGDSSCDEPADEPADATACATAGGDWESMCSSVVFTLSTD